ncbi:MAG: adenine nucleotide alpha hydrolase [Thermoplasmata archaeon]|nr:adenine nucleotide alpha hydrolase [Thermoplasmata archaeon]
MVRAIKRRTVVSWSSGKDSAYALGRLRQDPQVELVGLLTTVTESFGRVSMHGVREELLELQSRRLGLPRFTVKIPYPCPNDVYDARMADVLRSLGSADVDTIAFGDLFLEDIRRYREVRLDGTGFRPIFPLWGENTATLARAMISGGYRAILSCVDPKALDRSFAGREFDEALLADLPPSIDPCGERGEFHTFVYDAPIFSEPIPVRRGEVVERDGFVFTDLIPSARGTSPGPA